MGVFWAVFQCSSLVGGAISFIYYNQKPTGSTMLYVIFLSFILLGAFLTQLLLPPSMLRNTSNSEDGYSAVGNESRMTVNQNVSDDLPFMNDTTPLQIATTEQEGTSGGLDEDLSEESWYKEAIQTLRIFFTKP
eukprot:9819048-Ditylum_brightwellii.AAC.1